MYKNIERDYMNKKYLIGFLLLCVGNVAFAEDFVRPNASSFGVCFDSKKNDACTFTLGAGSTRSGFCVMTPKSFPIPQLYCGEKVAAVAVVKPTAK